MRCGSLNLTYRSPLGAQQASSKRSNSSGSIRWMAFFLALGMVPLTKGERSRCPLRTNQWQKARAERA